MKSSVSLLSAMVMAVSSQMAYAVPADSGFVAEYIRLEGLKRIKHETVYADLPITSGDQITPEILNTAVKALYATGHFSDVRAVRRGNELVFVVVERPIISRITFTGNSLIKEDDLRKGLKSVGLQEGDVLKQSLLLRVEKDLEQQFISQGRYNADVVIEQTQLTENSVALDVKFYEGDAAKVVDVNIIGNTHFSKSDINRVFAVRERSWRTLLNKKDRYAKEKLAASLENLRSLYLNEGFIKFEVNNAMINVSEDRKKVFIEISIAEGKQYRFGSVQFLGNPQYTDERLNKLSDIQTGELFSQKALTKSTQKLSRLYGNAGYFFAKVRPIPRVDDDTKTVDIDYFIDPGSPVYVRRINFSGNTKTADHVLRREMRQLEGALASNEKIDLSKIRLQRTGFFKTVNVETVRVPDMPDKIDVNIRVEEQPSGTTNLAAGYSQGGGLTFQAGLTQTNFLGTGNAVDIQLSRSDTVDNYSVGVTNPYFTIDGVSQGMQFYYRKTKTDSLNINNYLTDSIGARLTYGYPVDENKRLSGGIGIDQTTVKAGQSIAVSNLDYMLNNDGFNISQAAKTKTNQAANPITNKDLENSQRFESKYITYNANLAWSMDTRDTPVFPTKGMSHIINLEAALPGSDVEYQKVTYQGNLYQPIYGGVVGRAYTRLGYGNDLPFYKNFTAGGFGSLRGYRNGKLGPTSSQYNFVKLDDPENTDPTPEYIGGNALAQVGAELVLPLPFKGDWTKQVRPVVFAEGAQVFDTTDRDQRNFNDGGKTYAEKLIKQDEQMRYTAGASVTWLTAIGPISLSYAYPLNSKKKDETKRLQFEIGRVF